MPDSKAPLALRLAGPDDWAALARLIDAMDLYYGDPARLPRETEAAAKAWLRGEDSDTRFALAFDGTEAVGLACFAILHPGNELRGLVFLKDLFVLESWRGQRIGERIMAFLADYCGQRGIGRIDWVVENERSQAFYEGLGATVQEQKTFMRLDADAIAKLAEG